MERQRMAYQMISTTEYFVCPDAQRGTRLIVVVRGEVKQEPEGSDAW